MKTNLLISVLATLIFLFMGCTEKELLPESDPVLSLKSSNAKLKIAVITDIHYMDQTMLPETPGDNPDFQTLLFNSYNKMIELSEPIFDEAISELRREKPDVLLITGDLANNGELANHEIVKNKLQKLADNGTQVLVIPGNNDINSPDAKSYSGTGSTSVPVVNPEEFATLYGGFGYNDALYRDVNSLSYIFQVRENLWVLGIDACIYSPSYSRRGNINANTMLWIQEKMTEANEKGITVLAMMHHGIAEHYAGQNLLFRGDVVNSFSSVATSFMNAGIKIVFTGHSHANDIVEISGNGNSIWDIETCALATPISPYRVLTIDDNFIKIEARRITKIDKPFPGGKSFLDYSNSYLAEHLDMYFNWYLVAGMKLPSAWVEASMPYVKNAMVAQYAGDEQITPEEVIKLEEISALYPTNPLIQLINNFWTDLPPVDNEIHIKMK
jgi:predicted MPP superfamily phosphohydrolase